MRTTTPAAAAALFGIAGAAWWAFDGTRGAAEGGRHDPDLASGAAIYAEACASCHGAELEGQAGWRTPGPDGRLKAPPHDATGHTWHHPDRVLLDIATRGSSAVVGGGYVGDMPGFGDVYSEAELRDVLAWIKARWPERERSYQAQITARDETMR